MCDILSMQKSFLRVYIWTKTGELVTDFFIPSESTFEDIKKKIQEEHCKHIQNTFIFYFTDSPLKCSTKKHAATHFHFNIILLASFCVYERDPLRDL